MFRLINGFYGGYYVDLHCRCENTVQQLSPRKTPGVSCGNGPRAEDDSSKVRVLEIQKISRFLFSLPQTFYTSTSKPELTSITHLVKTCSEKNCAHLLTQAVLI